MNPGAGASPAVATAGSSHLGSRPFIQRMKQWGEGGCGARRTDTSCEAVKIFCYIVLGTVMFLFGKIVVRYCRHVQGIEAEQAVEAEAGNFLEDEDKRSGGILTDKTTLSNRSSWGVSRLSAQ